MSEVGGALHVLDRGTGSPTLLFVHVFEAPDACAGILRDACKEDAVSAS